MSPRRWFGPEAVDSAISSLERHSRDPVGESSVTPDQENTERAQNVTLAAGGIVAFILVLVLVLGTFAEREDPDWEPTPRTFLLPAFLVLGAGGVAWSMTVQSQKRRRGSSRAFAEVASRDNQLVAVGGRRLVGSDLGVVPWFDTEEHVSDEQMNVCINLAGMYRQHDLSYVECTHVVDPMSGLPSLSRTLGSFAVSRMKRLALRGMDTAIFLERLTDLPDLLVVPNSDPTAGQYLAVLGNGAHELAKAGNIPQQIDRKYWIATTESNWLGRLFSDRLTSLLSGRDWCMIQVIGGYCVVMTRWLRKSVFSHASRKERHITADLDFAAAVFDELRRYSSRGADMESRCAVTTPDESQAVYEESLRTREESLSAPLNVAVPMTERAIPLAQQSPPLFDRPNLEEAVRQSSAMAVASPQPIWSFLRVLAKVCAGFVGALAILIGIFTLCMYGPDLLWGKGSRDWPSVQGVMVKSTFEEKQLGSSVFFTPEFSYSYEVEGKTHTSERLQFGFRRADTREMADELIAAYPEGAEVAVHYNPNRHGMATLRIGLFEADHAYVGLGIGICILVFGFVMIWLSLPARKRKSTAEPVSRPGNWLRFVSG